jgi:hypothetical protein
MGRTGQKEIRMNTTLDDAKIVVIQSLQARQSGSSPSGTLVERAPGSRTSLSIERAIDYALSPRRKQQQPAFLERDVLRNARLATRRAAAVEERGVTEIAMSCAPTHHAFTGQVNGVRSSGLSDRPLRPASVRSCGPAGKVAGTAIVTSVTPEDEAVARDLERRLCAQVRAELGALAEQIFRGMIDGDSAAESAARLTVSTRTVERVRNKIRVLATTVIAVDDVAA